MADFELIGDAVYRVTGELTEEDIARINSFPVRTCLVLQNTKGQTSEMIGKISTDKAYFSVLGGLDYFEKSKYNKKDYIERTYSSPEGLTEVLKYFEQIESEINPEWTDVQKCMYAYSALIMDTEYVKKLDQDIISNEITERSLNGVLYHQLTCAGMAKVFKEMMDRMDINCYYQNQKSVHAFNVVELAGKLRGVDVTWDCVKTAKKGKLSYENFGQDPLFYKRHGHRIEKDEEETVFDLSLFTPEEIEENFAVIEEALKSRQVASREFRSLDIEAKKRFLPVDRYKDELLGEATIFTELLLLEKMGRLPQEMQGSMRMLHSRYGLIADYIGMGLNYSPEQKPICSAVEEITSEKNVDIRNNELYCIKDGERTLVPEEYNDKIAAKFLEDIR